MSFFGYKLTHKADLPTLDLPCIGTSKSKMALIEDTRIFFSVNYSCYMFNCGRRLGKTYLSQLFFDKIVSNQRPVTQSTSKFHDHQKSLLDYLRKDFKRNTYVDLYSTMSPTCRTRTDFRLNYDHLIPVDIKFDPAKIKV